MSNQTDTTCEALGADRPLECLTFGPRGLRHMRTNVCAGCAPLLERMMAEPATAIMAAMRTR